MFPVLPLLLAATLQQRADSLDVLITRGTVYDGSGGPSRVVDIGIRGDRIAFVGDAAAAKVVAKRTLDARGLIVSPGFIDPHTHSFEGLPGISEERRKNLSALFQGVTTVVLGADGRGPTDVANVLRKSEEEGIGTNTYALAGFGTVRSRVMGASSAAASPEQVAQMRGMISKAMSEGAYGVGTGLFYAPQSYATTEEVIAVLKGATPYGGVYDTHQRDESSYTIGLLNSVRETIRIGRETGLTTNIGHVKALGVDVWGYADSVLRLMREARAAGQVVVADQYPWTASGTGLGAALLPRWAQAGGRDSMNARIADPATKAKILAEMRDNLRRRGGDTTLLLLGGKFSGKYLNQVAKAKQMPAVEAALDEIRSGGDVGVASFNMIESDIEKLMKDPFVMTSSDGSGGHPRLYATYPRKIRKYVLDKPVITMQRMVQASSEQVAQTYGLAERGSLKTGYYADVIVFDPKTIRDVATYVEPAKLSVGMRWVMVNGKFAIDSGKSTGVMAGRGLRKRVAADGSGPQASGLEVTIRARLDSLNATSSFYAKDLGTGQEIAIRADVPMNTASVIKIPIMVLAFRDADAGKLNLDERVTISPEDVRTGTGILQGFAVGLQPTIRDFIWQMIVTSDNTATDLMIGKLGMARVNALLDSLGYKNTRLQRTVKEGLAGSTTYRPPGLADTSAAARRFAYVLDSTQWLGKTTAREISRLLEQIETGALASPKSTADMRRILRGQMYGTRLPVFARAKVTIAHKTGDWPPILGNDVGIMYPPQPAKPIVIAVFTNANRGRFYDLEMTEARCAEDIVNAWVK